MRMAKNLPLTDEALEMVARRFAVLAEPMRLRLIQELRPAYNVRGTRYRASLAFIKVTGGHAPRLAVTESVSTQQGIPK